MEEKRSEIRDTTRVNLTRREFFQLMAAGFIGGGAAGVLLGTVNEADRQRRVPQGFWQAAEVVNGRLIARVNAYSLDPYSAIQYVDITLRDSNGDWRTICRVTQSEISDTFVCNEDISAFVHPGDIAEVSFNVVSTNGLVSKAPNGVKKITIPSAGS